jgi:phosphohistidine phosphatase
MPDRFVILLRHGIAEPRGSKPDEKRSLTTTGRQRLKEIGRALARIFPRPDAVYSSPLLRCTQSAEQLVKAYRKLEFTTSEALRPDADPSKIRKLLETTKSQRVICVGHEPGLSAIMRELTKVEGDFELKKGGCYGIRIEGSDARLEWMLPPRVLRRV